MNKREKIEENRFKIIENRFSILESMLQIVRTENKMIEIKMEQIYLLQFISSKYFFVFGAFITLLSILLTIYSIMRIIILIPLIALTILFFCVYMIKEKIADKNFRKRIVEKEIRYWKSKGLSKEDISKKLTKYAYLFAK